jgi:predicted acetyltransferase
MPIEDAFSLVRATVSDRSTIERLIQLYLYDMASDRPFPIEENGAYEYTLLDRFWEHVYLLRVSNEIAGFALVISNCPITNKAPCWFMAEFFVLRYHRRKSLARKAVQEILALHPGAWHVATQIQNTGADLFWSRVLPQAERKTFEARFDEADWLVRSFVVPEPMNATS